MEGKAGKNKHKTPQIIPVKEAKHVKEKILIQMTGKAAVRSEPLPQQKKIIRNQGQGSSGSRKEDTRQVERSDEKVGSEQHVWQFQAERK